MNMSPPRLITGFLLLMLASGVYGQSWWEAATLPRQDVWADERPLPKQYDAIQIDQAELLSLLASAPHRFRGEEGLLLPFPGRDLEEIGFRFFLDPVMHPALAAKFPEIQNWYGYDPAWPARQIRLGVGPGGWHAMITAPGEESFFMDAWDRLSPDGPVVTYLKSDYISPEMVPFHCEVLHGEEDDIIPESDEEGRASGPSLLNYRLALACTGEYAQFHGGTKLLVLAAMVKTISRVNGIYERDFGARMELIPDNDKIIFLNPLTDPYDNGSLSAMLGQNQQTIDALIGTDNYDVGHVFGTQGGGLATLSSLCKTNKARAATGRPNPVGDPFDVDYVAHEFGHQFGCNHTFNNSCDGNRYNPGAMEPGSGTTIMAYAGVCSPSIKNLSDDYFHVFSLIEAQTYIINGFGNTCPEKLFTGNQSPLVNAGPDRTIPHSTPFELSAEASDPEGDPLTFTWEQYDNQIAPMPPSGTHPNGPLFRSLPPDTSHTRVFPSLGAIRLNQNPTWEVLPKVGRSMRFRVTARDNHPDHGRWSQDLVVITVAGDSGPFLVTQPNTSLVWQVGDTVTVNWDVANTDQSPVNCSHVNIALSTDGGWTYPILLAANAPNSGSAQIVVPFALSQTCRVKIKGSDNYFFDISNQNFRIEEPATPGFTAMGLSDSLAYCLRQDTTLFEVALRPLSGFAEEVACSLEGLTFGGTDLPPTILLSEIDTLRFRVWDIEGVGEMGPDSLLLRMNSSWQERSLVFRLYSSEPITQAVTPLSPPDNSEGIPRMVTLTWSPISGVERYSVYLSARAAFEETEIQIYSTADTSVEVDLAANTTWFWKVQALNHCGENPPMPVQAFRTILLDCEDYPLPNTPLITENAATYNYAIEVEEGGAIADLNVTIDLQYSDLEKLILRIIHPSGIGRNLLFRTCAGGQDVAATFSDYGQDFSCGAGVPAVSGLLKPQTGPLSNMFGLQASGSWTLRVIDESDDITGMLNAAVLGICRTAVAPPQPQLVWLDTVYTAYCGEGLVNQSHLAVLDTLEGPLFLTLREAPVEGRLYLDGQVLVEGDTIPVMALTGDQLVYHHSGGSVLSDRFRVDIFNGATKGWLGGLWVEVALFTNIQSSLDLEEAIRCHGDSTGRVSVAVSGAKPPFTYRLLPGGDWQTEAVFEGLTAGNYAFVVRDANGFEHETQVIELTQPEALMLTYTVIGDQIQLEASGGVVPYLYIMGVDSNATGVFTLSGSGIYVVEVLDGHDCRLTEDLQIDLLQVVVDALEPLCYGEASGSLEILVSGGAGPFEFRLNNGDWQTHPLFEGLVAGAYQPGVRDTALTVYLLDTILIEEPEPLLLIGNQSADSTVTLIAEGGTPPWLYRLDQGAWQSTGIFSGLPSGEYRFYLTDAHDCLDSLDLTIKNTSTLQEGPFAGQLVVYPNPAREQVHVLLQGRAGQIIYWTLMDLAGRPAMMGEVQTEQWIIPIAGLPPGVYYLRLRSEREAGTVLLYVH